MGDELVKAEALQILGRPQVLPRLVVFDLDHTIWPLYWSDSPLAFLHSSIYQTWMAGWLLIMYMLFDSRFDSDCCSIGDSPILFRHAKGIMCALKEKGIDMAIASRSSTPDIANAFLDKLELQSMFVTKEIYDSWTHKTEHFQRIQMTTGIPYESMLFFDDEYRNFDSVSKMGVTSILVEWGRGVNLDMFKLGLDNFAASSTPVDTLNG